MVRIKLYLTIVFSLPVFTLAQTEVRQVNMEIGSIHFYYGGENNKPFPQIRFHLPGDIDTVIRFLYQYEVSRDTLSILKSIIDNRKIDSFYTLPEGFFIKTNLDSKHETAIITDDHVIRDICVKIIRLYYSTPMEFDLRSVFGNMLKRLGSSLY